ncbi:MAG TPA: PQQ-binding-like beta-propeller repeat protein [Pirellulales bacterium]|nr:PQQ-binding-like beta-propeller repeat protein [Pirellulales bacterium]
MPRSIRTIECAVAAAVFLFDGRSEALAQHRLLVQGSDKLAIVNRDGQIEWQMPWGGIHDMHVLADGHIVVQQGANKVAEIDPENKRVVWTYDSGASRENRGKTIEVHAFQPLADGQMMIAESGAGRIIEIDRDGHQLRDIRLKIDHPHPHTDTRLARKLDNGHYLVCHEGDGVVREYDGSGKVTWEYPVPLFGREPKPGHGPEAFGNKCFAALRLSSGNTLISTGNGHSVLEVTPDKEIVGRIEQNDLSGITLAWVTTVAVLPNGNYLIGNCHAGPGQPLVIELEPRSKKVVWTFDGYDTSAIMYRIR